MKLSLMIGVILFCATFVAVGQGLPRLTFIDGSIQVAGLGAEPPSFNITEHEWKQILRVYTHEALLKSIDQPVGGKYLWKDDAIWFTPTFPFTDGTVYYAVFCPQAFSKNTGASNTLINPDKLELTFKIPRKTFASTSIKSVYPESDVVPENLLRMYICFSGSMMPGEAYDHIKLYNDRGELIEKPFLIIDQELWDAGRTRLTVLFDPGRIKRGLKSNLDLGPPLNAGQNYHLVIDSTWQDVNGNYLKGNFEKTFYVTSPNRTKIYAKDLKISPPLADSREPVIISFDRMIDHALVPKYITVQSPLSGTLRGEFELINDSVLKFVPDRPWRSGNYTIAISPLLEDVSGNNFNNAFDLDLLQESRVNSGKFLTLEFLIKDLAQ